VIAVSDASPLINLAYLGQLDLLRQLYGQVAVPQRVWDEVVARGAGRPGSAEVAAATWITVHPAPLTQVWPAIHQGEAEAITLALRLGADLLLMDEALGRAVARQQGLRVSGVVGVLLAARRRRLLGAVRPMLDRLRAAGFRLSKRVYDEALRRAGELD
jgi:hypothetical protein